MSSINSNRKGKVGEREFAKWLRTNLQIEARRGQQYSGGGDSPDVVSSLRIHWECKRVQALNIYKAVEQAANDHDSNTTIPAVAHRKNHKEWLITIRAKDLKRFAEEVNRNTK